MSLRATKVDFWVKAAGAQDTFKSQSLDCSIAGCKQAFLLAMEQFANSPDFEAFAKNFESEFTIKVKQSVTLSMPE